MKHTPFTSSLIALLISVATCLAQEASNSATPTNEHPNILENSIAVFIFQPALLSGVETGERYKAELFKTHKSQIQLDNKTTEVAFQTEEYHVPREYKFDSKSATGTVTIYGSLRALPIVHRGWEKLGTTTFKAGDSVSIPLPTRHGRAFKIVYELTEAPGTIKAVKFLAQPSIEYAKTVNTPSGTEAPRQ